MLTLHKYKLEKNADSIEFCPHAPNQSVFACANYELDAETKENSTVTRSGRVCLFSVTTGNGLALLQLLECCGVLDMKWCPNKIEDRSVLAVADAEGSVGIYELTPEVKLRLLTKIIVESDESIPLILSLDFSASQRPKIVCSDSKGFVHELVFEHDGLAYINGCKAHDYECWVATYDHFRSDVFYSGGDDSVFLTHDCRTRTVPVYKNRTHDAGVTSIRSSPKNEHLVATGSYDTFLRLWDTRRLKDCLSKLELPGTLWRLKWDPFGNDYLLAACMLGGAHIVGVDIKNYEGKVIGSYKEHESLVYGIDWCYLSEEKIAEVTNVTGYLIGSCSFYDNLLCLSIHKK